MKGNLSGLGLLFCSGLAWGQLPGNVALTPAFGTQAANKFIHPLWFGEVPGLPNHYLVAEQGNMNVDSARIWLLEPSGAAYVKKVFHSLKPKQDENEMGLLGFAFHPAFAANRKYYLNYIQVRTAGGTDSTIIEERTAASDFKKDSGNPPRRILAFSQTTQYHNGGSIAFGKDGYLYAGLGDDSDPAQAQARKKLGGAILRLDVDNPAAGMGYGIPADNPFVGETDASIRKEIWVNGLRNPWKWSFDPLTADLWIGDVGQSDQEEIDIARKGENMGWPYLEGTRCVSNCSAPGLVPPVKTFGRDSANCITGGVVYRGNSASPFYGAYIFGDAYLNHIWALIQDKGKVVEMRRIAGAPANIVSFGTDRDGNIYAVGLNSGVIYLLDHPQLKPPTIGLQRPDGPALREQRLQREGRGYRLDPAWAGEVLGIWAFSSGGRKLGAWTGPQAGMRFALPAKSGLCLLKIATRNGTLSKKAYLE